jgi:cobalt-precorrin-5B (C1)-methyltransferase
MQRADLNRPLRRGWTTGTCAAAASRAAYQALLTGAFPDPVPVLLPNGARPSFALAFSEHGPHFARAGVVKDAGDDPDVTHGALIVSTIRLGAPGSGIIFRAGEGVGTVTRPGLPLPPGQPAINPVPREMIATAIAEVAAFYGGSNDAIVELSIPGGKKIAERTLNARLGIVGGLSILGTTGIVVPYSCAAWIHSIHRGIDVARATGLDHVAGATGATSEAAIARLYRLPEQALPEQALPEQALIDMGDFVGGMLKYLRRHPVPRVTVAGGMAKMTKLAQGLLDLHSRRGEVDLHWLSQTATDLGGDPQLAVRIIQSNSAMEAFGHAHAAGVDLPQGVAASAWKTAAKALGTGMQLEIVIFDRSGQLLARTGFH